MAASFEFYQAAVKIHYNAGMNENGRLIRKTKTYPHAAHTASAANMSLALTQLASLSSYPVLKIEKIVTDDVFAN